jgi:hypothetical protein
LLGFVLFTFLGAFFRAEAVGCFFIYFASGARF